MIEICCPKCAKVIHVGDSYAGKQGRCLGCGTLLTAPAPIHAVVASASATVAPAVAVPGLVALSCPNCGGTVEQGSGGLMRCQYCGSQIVQQPVAAAASLQIEHSHLNCPGCHRDDQVQRVTSVVSSAHTQSQSKETLSGAAYSFGGGGLTLGGGTVSKSIESVTLLGRRLAMQNKPSASNLSFLGFGLAAFLFVVVVSVFSAHEAVAGVVFLLVMGGLISLSVWRFKRDRRSWRNRLQVWEHQQTNWRALFYCQRCDRVFYQGDPSGLPPERMSELLARP